jgi:hypothetical protein
MGYVTCPNDVERWVGNLWVKTPSESPQVTYKTTCVDFNLQDPLEDTDNVKQVQEDMRKVLSGSKDWDFVF